MKIHKFLIIGLMVVLMTAGSVSGADNSTQKEIISDDSSQSENIGITDAPELSENDDLSENNFEDNTLNANESVYKGKYYLFRGDCWTIANNFESSAAITSETLDDFTVTGTFRSQSDTVGIYWNSKDIIEHPFISYSERSNYTGVVLEFDCELTGCRDFRDSTLTIASNSGETYYLKMNRFTEDSHVTLNFDSLTLLAGDSYIDKDGQAVTVSDETGLDVSDLKYIMLLIVPVNFADDSQYTIMENENFTFRVSNITVINGEICDEFESLSPHQYRLCEGYDDSYNLNPLRLCKEMRKLGYTDWVDLYIGASYFYEKSGVAGEAITDLGFNHNRTEMMVLDKNTALNAAFRAWLDCYSRELKNNGVENLVISVSMENLQCPQSWRQMDSNGNFAMSGWSPSTFLISPCSDEAVRYMQNVSRACLDIVVSNGLKPILQMGETWWWWQESDRQTPSPCFYDNSTKAKYLLETGKNLPEYENAWTEDYDEVAITWLNLQLVRYSDALREVAKSYDEGLYLALFFTPSVIDETRVPAMIREANYIKDAYSPDKLDILQIEDYDWVIYENANHNLSYTIGQELGFNESQLQYFGGFVEKSEDAETYWPLIVDAMDDALNLNFAEAYVWAGSQIRRDNKILGYDETDIIESIKNKTYLLKPDVTAPDYVSVGENFTIMIHAKKDEGVFSVYEYVNGQKGDLITSNAIKERFSKVNITATTPGENWYYLEFDYSGEVYALIKKVNVIENSKNVKVNVSDEIETKDNITVSLTASKTGIVHIGVDDNESESYNMENEEFEIAISPLSEGYHTVHVKYNDNDYITGEMPQEAYSNTFTVNVGERTFIKANNVNTYYNSSENLTVSLLDSTGNPLSEKNITITLNGVKYNRTTDDNGETTLTIDIPAGNYTADIYYAGKSGQLSSKASVNVNVDRIKTYLGATNISIVYGNLANLAITLKDSDGFLAGENITVNLDNKVYIRTTDINGRVELPLTVNGGTYTAEIAFNGSDIYNPADTTARITVKKATSKLSVSSKKFKAKAKTKKVAAKLTFNGKGVKNEIVKLKVNKKTYKAKTNSKGIAKFKIKLTRKGRYSAVYKFAGDTNLKSVKKTAKIIIK